MTHDPYNNTTYLPGRTPRPSFWSNWTLTQQLWFLGITVIAVCAFFVCMVVFASTVFAPTDPTATPQPTQVVIVASATPGFIEDPYEGPLLGVTPFFPQSTPTPFPVFNVPTPTALPRVDGLNVPQPTPWIDPNAQPADPIVNQAGGVQPIETPWWTTPTAPVFPTAIPTTIPVVPRAPQFISNTDIPLPMPPLTVSIMECGVNPVFVNVPDPRIGCRMPSGTVVMSAQIWINGELVLSAPQTSSWNLPNAVAVPQAGQILIWQAKNNVSCVAWNLPTTQRIGLSDSIQVVLTANNQATFTGFALVQPVSRSIANPTPIAHACGFSPDGTRLRVEQGDTLNRFILGYDLALSNQPIDAWWRTNSTFTVGQEYPVPNEWRTQQWSTPQQTK